MTFQSSLILILYCASFVYATKVNPCKSGISLTEDKINIYGCEIPPCKFVRNTNLTADFTFTPESDVQKLTMNVYATVLGIKQPYAGLDGKGACDSIYLSDGTPVGCPLKAGQEYKFMMVSFVKPTLPKVNAVLHTSLREKSKDIVCYEVPIKIV